MVPHISFKDSPLKFTFKIFQVFKIFNCNSELLAHSQYNEFVFCPIEFLPMNEIKTKLKTKENVLWVQIKHVALSTVISHTIESDSPLPIQYIYLPM